MEPSPAIRRRFDQLPSLVVPDDFNDALPAAELAAWEDTRDAKIG